jgi:hypothetical protein
MSLAAEAIPALSNAITPPIVLGTADLTHFAYLGNDLAALVARIDAAANATATYDLAIALQLGFRRADGLNLLDQAVTEAPVVRIGHRQGLRVLALACPGDLMANTPLDFLTNFLGVRLDILHIVPGQPLPVAIPDHDIAFIAATETDPAIFARLCHLFVNWPRPILNDPSLLPLLERDALARHLAGLPGIRSPAAIAVSGTALDDHLRTGRPLPSFPFGAPPYPCLIRPHGSHAGSGLSKAETPADLAAYLRTTAADRFTITEFEDYAGPDRLYRKLRVAFIDRRPYLCHMAVSPRWMVHYLNADMTESAPRRAEEQAAMESFDTGFAHRHAAAFATLTERLPFDYFSIDCAETRDGRLLVFEADTAAIVHMMDPPDLFPYKQPQMRRIFAAFEAMLRQRVASDDAPIPSFSSEDAHGPSLSSKDAPG